MDVLAVELQPLVSLNSNPRRRLHVIGSLIIALAETEGRSSSTNGSYMG